MASTKNWVVHTSAGVVAGALIVFGALQWWGKKQAEKENVVSDNHYKTAVADNRKCVLMIDSLQNQNSFKDAEIGRKADTIVFQAVQIQLLGDTIRSLEASLEKCRKKAKPGVNIRTVVKDTCGCDTVKKVKPQPKPQPKDTCNCDTVVRDTVSEYRAPVGYIKISREYRIR